VSGDLGQRKRERVESTKSTLSCLINIVSIAAVIGTPHTAVRCSASIVAPSGVACHRGLSDAARYTRQGLR